MNNQITCSGALFYTLNTNRFLFLHRAHGKRANLWGLVGGTNEGAETPWEGLKREIQEEIGLRALELEEILVHRSSGTVNSNFYFFLATNLIPDKLQNPDGEDSVDSIKKIKLIDIKKMLEDGELKWSLCTLGLFKVLNRYNLYN